MPTRIEIELTSAGADGSWTWRAAGAREPKGTLDGSILPAGASVGDQLKVESEKDLDGIHILGIVQPKQKADRDGLLELLPTGDFEPVIQQRATRDRHDGGRGGPRRERGDRGDRERGDRRGPRREGEGGAGAGGGGDRGDRRPRRDGEGGGGGGGDRRPARPHFTPPPELPQRPKPKRLRPGKLRRAEVLAGLPEEQRPVAELALQGLAAVRQRLREDNARLKAEDKPGMPEATVLKMAENLLPQLRVADWLDRAEAAKRQLAHLDLRDLRSVVTASDDPSVVRDESTRELAAELKAALVTKQDEELNLWLTDVEAAVDVGRVVRALRLSAMPPKAGVPFPQQLGARLGEVTTSSLSPEDAADRWIAVLEAAAFSPVRTLVTPAAAPAQPGEELVATVTRLAPLLPQIAALFGIAVPEKAPTPKPLRLNPRKKEAAKADQSRHGKTASHPGPKPERQPKPAVEARASEADGPAAGGAHDADATEPQAPSAVEADAPAQPSEPEVPGAATEASGIENAVAAVEPTAPDAPEAGVADAGGAEDADASGAEPTEPDAPEAGVADASGAEETQARAPASEAAATEPAAPTEAPPTQATDTEAAEPVEGPAGANNAPVEIVTPEATEPEAPAAELGDSVDTEAAEPADAQDVDATTTGPDSSDSEVADTAQQAPEAEVTDSEEAADTVDVGTVEPNVQVTPEVEGEAPDPAAADDATVAEAEAPGAGDAVDADATEPEAPDVEDAAASAADAPDAEVADIAKVTRAEGTDARALDDPADAAVTQETTDVGVDADDSQTGSPDRTPES